MAIDTKKSDQVRQIRKLSQWYAYTSIEMHETVGRKAGLSGTDHKYLGFLLQKGEMTAGELGTLTGLTSGAITGIIDRFEKKGLVKRKFTEGDRRRVIIEPDTQKIMDLLAPLYKDYRSESEKLLATYSADEIKVLESYFEKAIAIMKKTTENLQK